MKGTGWRVRWMRRGVTRSRLVGTYEQALTLKDWLEAGGAADVTVEEEEG